MAILDKIKAIATTPVPKVGLQVWHMALAILVILALGIVGVAIVTGVGLGLGVNKRRNAYWREVYWELKRNNNKSEMFFLDDDAFYQAWSKKRFLEEIFNETNARNEELIDNVAIAQQNVKIRRTGHSATGKQYAIQSEQVMSNKQISAYKKHMHHQQNQLFEMCLELCRNPPDGMTVAVPADLDLVALQTDYSKLTSIDDKISFINNKFGEMQTEQKSESKSIVEVAREQLQAEAPASTSARPGGLRGGEP